MILFKTKKAALRAVLSLLSLILLITAIPLPAIAVYYDKADYDDIKTEDLEAMREQLAEYDKLLAEIKTNLAKAEELQATAAERRVRKSLRSVANMMKRMLSSLTFSVCHTRKEPQIILKFCSVLKALPIFWRE